MKIILFGPQGSGKSTQGKLLSEYLQIPFISTGDLFREEACLDTEEGRKIKQILESGKLVDDETVIGLVKKRVAEKDCQDGFILDGTPRTLKQAYALEDLNFDKAIYFNLPKEEVLARLLKRGREDDTKELIEQRLRLYFVQTEPVIEYYKNKGILHTINGVGTVEDIQQKLVDSSR